MDNIDFGSDSDDQSDEDYCPLKETTEVLSEDESGNESHDSGGEDETTPKAKHTKTAGGLKKKPTKSRKRKADIQVEQEQQAKAEDVDKEADEKSHADALWASFLDEPKKVAGTTPNEPVVKKQIVTETLEFAGEKIEVVKEVAVRVPSKESSLFDVTPSSKSNNVLVPGRSNGAAPSPGTASALAAAGRGPPQRKFGGGAPSGGLNSILGQIGKKNKISVLEKSAMDWKTFKTVEGIDEQLKTHNKGKDGYLEGQDFLQRADLRQFEIEKELRTVQRSKR